MQSLSSSRPCTAHFSGGNLLLLLLHCLLAKPQKYFILYYLKTAPFLPVSYPFWCSTWCLQHVRAKSWAVPAPVCVQSSLLVGTGTLQELLPLPPKGLPGSVSLTPGRAVRTLKNTISLFGFLSLVTLFSLLTNITRCGVCF